jgi:hypothetical protein
MEENQVLQDKILRVFHATLAAFQSNPKCGKIIENPLGRGVYYFVSSLK